MLKSDSEFVVGSASFVVSAALLLVVRSGFFAHQALAPLLLTKN
jgi:hypothetical protein